MTNSTAEKNYVLTNEYNEQSQKVLSKEQTELLEKYFEAMGHFYYIIPLKKVYDIINGQYEENYSEDDFLKFAEAVPFNQRLHCDLVGEDFDDDSKTPIFERNLVHESILMDYDVYDDLMYSKRGKNDYFIPPKEELLKYTDDLYEPKSPQYRAMRSFVARYQDVGAREAEDRLFELMFNIRDGVSSPLAVVNKMSRFSDIHIYAEHYYEFETLFIDLYNHIRNPHLNGYTPEEYLQMTNAPDESMYAVKENIPEEEIIDELSEAVAACEYFQYEVRKFRENIHMLASQNQQTVKKKKIGRNDPCPCGSGKKYKKCCGANL